MIDVLRLGADLWLLVAVVWTLWFVISTTELKGLRESKTEMASMVVLLPSILWAGLLSVLDAWALLIELVERV